MAGREGGLAQGHETRAGKGSGALGRPVLRASCSSVSCRYSGPFRACGKGEERPATDANLSQSRPQLAGRDRDTESSPCAMASIAGKRSVAFCASHETSRQDGGYDGTVGVQRRENAWEASPEGLLPPLAVAPLSGFGTGEARARGCGAWPPPFIALTILRVKSSERSLAGKAARSVKMSMLSRRGSGS